jgi:PAS domain S-box-containing protein
MGHEGHGHGGHDHDHGEMMEELAAHFEPILEESPDGVYLWAGPGHMVCNDKMAKLFGVTPDEFAATDDFLDAFVDPKDQQRFGDTFNKHVGHVAGPVRFRFKAKRKDGKTFDAETDMIPIGFAGHVIAYHFVRKV